MAKTKGVNIKNNQKYELKLKPKWWNLRKNASTDNSTSIKLFTDPYRTCRSILNLLKTSLVVPTKLNCQT